MKVLATAGLDYGANCQLYFDGKTYIINGSIYDYITAKENGLANATTNPSNAISANQPDEASYKATYTNNIGSDISFVGASLILGLETSIKVYYKYTGTETLTFSAVSSKGAEKTVSVQLLSLHVCNEEVDQQHKLSGESRSVICCIRRCSGYILWILIREEDKYMMTNYHDPEMEIILLPENDVIVTSPGDCQGETEIQPFE